MIFLRKLTYLILENFDWTRFIGIFLSESILGVIFFLLSYKILRRNLNRLSLILSCFYISVALASVINIIYYPLKTNPIVYVLQFVTLYLFYFSQVFLLLFVLNIKYLKKRFSVKVHVVIVLFFIVTIFLLFNLPGGITINKNTNWRPVYSLTFIFLLYIFSLSFVVIPTVIFSIKILKNFQDHRLKAKWRFFLIGIFGLIINLYGVLLYNATFDPIIRISYIMISFLMIPFGLFIYHGIGRDL